jgi:BirA family biotin operon repressor/biotin-[acetyl-CoA-carboxylase] ligase
MSGSTSTYPALADATGLARVPILALDEIDSTNAGGRRRAEAGETGPLWIIAARQTAGRGRRGRDWRTAEGNLAASLLMLTERTPADAAQVSFVAALAASDLARSCLPAQRVRLKWPNDLLVDGRKAAGVLIESGLHASGRLWLVVGVGVNLVHAPILADRPATSFAEAGAASVLTPREALDRLAASFAGWLGLWNDQGFAVIAEAWTARAYGLGEPCIARLNAETVEGIAEGLDVDGALRLRRVDGVVRRITAGDVFFGGA